MDKLILKYLNKTLNADEQQELFYWLKDNYENQKYFLKIYRIWIVSQYDSDSIQIDQEYEKLQSKMRELNEVQSKRKPKKRLKTFIAISVGIAASLFIGLLFVDRVTIDSKVDIMRYANQNKVPINTTGQTTLILSEDKVLSFDENETSISYDEDSINTNANTLISQEESDSYNQLIVPYGKKSVLTFSDGTKLWANAGTRVIYPVKFDVKQREIFVDGEIYINVTPDKSRPFIAKTQTMNVQVLGTKFCITDYNEESDKRVVLVSGAVNVKSNAGKKPVLLQPDHMYERNEHGESVTTIDVKKYISWIDGMYIYDEEPLKNVLLRLSKYYKVEIECDAKSAIYLCSGKLDMRTNIEEVLEGLTYSLPISFSLKDGKYRVLLNK